MTTVSSSPMRRRLVAWLRALARELLPRRIQDARVRAAEARQHSKYKDMPVERVFVDIYRNNEWGGSEGHYFSGSGSHDPNIVTPYVREVSAFLEALPEKPVLVDLGSGDFNVGRHFVDLVEHYNACDIVPDLQEYNRGHFNFSNVAFLCVNAVEDNLPDGEVVCIRQVFQHLSNADIGKVVKKCRKYPYWIISEHLPAGADFVPNVDIAAGCGIRLLFNSGVVLSEPPFNVNGYSSRVLSEVPEYGGVIRTVLFERDKRD